MAAGGIMNLIAFGPQDVYLYDFKGDIINNDNKRDLSNSKVVYEKNTNFSIENNYIDINNLDIDDFKDIIIEIDI